MATNCYAPIFTICLQHTEQTFRLLETRVDPPVRKTLGSKGFVFRYEQQTIHQAILQKLARSITGLRAINVLLEAGLFQEQLALARVVDDMQEDVWFLSLAVIHDDHTERHKEFLAQFWAEEFADHDDVWGSHQSRGMVRRDKIRAYVRRETEDAGRGNIAGKIITKANSGFVHGASPQIMDMVYGHSALHFDLEGATKPFRYAEFASDALNYFYRGLLAAAVAAKAFGDEQLFERLRSASRTVEAKM